MTKCIEDSRLPKELSKRDAYAQNVGEDGFQLLDALESPQAPATLAAAMCRDVRQLWQDHYERQIRLGAPRGRSPHRPGAFQRVTGMTTDGGAHRIPR